MKKLKCGDEVIIVSGKDKGKRGKIIKFISFDYVVVENINLVKKHVRANPIKNTSGGILDKEMPIHISNLGIYDFKSNQVSKLGFKILENGKKVRVIKSIKEYLD